MASLLSLTETESDSVSMPSPIAISAGGTTTIPVSLTNSNTGYAAFEMQLVLPKGITPARNARGNIIVTKNADRLAESHSISCEYDETANTVKLLCASLSNELIYGTEGELFSISVQADASMYTGDYEATLTNVVFSTSTAAEGGAQSFFLADAKSVFTVDGVEPPAGITIYVACETAPFIWSWGASDGVDYNNGENWPGTNQFTKQVIMPETGEVFWAYSFPQSVKEVSFLFNNGDPSYTKQTSNITGVYSDRYFILSWDDGDGNVYLEDVTESYVVIPDAKVESLGISGNHNGWSLPEGSEFTVVDEGKTFTKTVDLSDFTDARWEFKLRPNFNDWVGFYDVTYDGNIPSWLIQDGYDGNFMVDLEQTGRIFTISATWAGGKDASKGWTVKIENTDLIDVPTALSIASSLASGESTTEYYTIRGTVSNILSIDTGNYGNATFYIYTPGYENQELYVYRAYSFNKEKFTDPNIFKVGDEVLLRARLTNYKGTTPETLQNDAWLLAVYPAGGGQTGDQEAFQMIADNYGIYSDGVTIETGYWWYSGNNMNVINPFTTTHKSVSCSYNGYYRVMIGNASFETYNGVQGNDNPKDADGGNPALTLKAPASGSVIQIEAKSNGWMYVAAKLSTNKQYMVFEDGVAIGYMYAMRVDDSRIPNNVMAGQVGTAGSPISEGTQVQWLIREYTGNAEAETAGNGLGVIYFPVKAGKTYQAFACGSKISWCGVCWSSLETSVKLGGDYGDLEIAVGNPEGKSQAYMTLQRAINSAWNVLNNTKLTSKGITMLQAAIATAEQALATEDDETMTAAAATLTAVVQDVLKNEQLITETITFNNYQYYYGQEYIQGQYCKLTPAPGNGSTPYSDYGYLRLNTYNTLTITSDIPMVDIVINISYVSSYGPSCICSDGQMENNHWTGDTQELTFNLQGYQGYSGYMNVSSIEITYDNPSNEDLVERIASQIEATNAALQALTYPVPGKAALEELVAQAATLTVETDAAVLKETLKQLKQQTAAVVELDNAYKQLAGLLDDVATTAEQNPYADATILAEATQQVTVIRAGLAEGAYSLADIQALTQQMNQYLAQLGQVYLTINVTVPGELGDLVLAKVSNFSDVVGLRISGTLNATDLSLIPSFTNLQELDMLGVTNITTIPNSQFQNMQTLVKVTLPQNTKVIGQYAFQNCSNLQEVITPNTLETIETEAFYDCRSLKSFNFNEGLKTIGNSAFYCNNNGYYDEYGNYQTSAGSLTEISLPSTLTTLGDYAFYNQNKVTKLTIADGLTTIGRYAFYYCSGLTDITWPSTLKTIGNYAFRDCDALTKVELPEGLTTLNSNAFRHCDNLEEVILPSSLQSVNNPFYYCNKLTKMTCKAIAAPNANNTNIMGGNEAQCTLTVPNLSVNMYKQTPYWNAFNIEGADIMPENIYVASDYRVNWPETSLDYRPNVHVAYMGSLYVSGQATFSANNFLLEFNGYQARNNTYYDQNMQRYFYNRDNCYAVVLNNAAGARANSVSVEMNPYPNNWEFMSLPFDAKVSDIQVQLEGMPFAIRKYDGAKRAAGELGTTWVDLTADDVINAGQGFILQRPEYNSYSEGRLTFTAEDNTNKNNLFANDDVVVALNEYLTEAQFEHNRSWNFIGNPYATYYDIRAMKTKAPITVWDTYNNNYQAFSPMDDAYILNPGQAFFVQRPIDEESITFLKEGRQIDMTVAENVDYSNRAMSTVERNVFNLTISGNEMGDRTRFVINSDAKLDYEAGRDANKFMSDVQTVELYTVQNGINFAINERPLADGIIELGLQVSVAGEYTIALDTKVVNEIYLIDRLTGQEIRIDDNDGYTFTAEQGLILGRFAIRIGEGDVTGIRTINNGQSTIDNYYNLNGIRVEEPSKGIYIQNGKKVVVK